VVACVDDWFDLRAAIVYLRPAAAKRFMLPWVLRLTRERFCCNMPCPYRTFPAGILLVVSFSAAADDVLRGFFCKRFTGCGWFGSRRAFTGSGSGASRYWFCHVPADTTIAPLPVACILVEGLFRLPFGAVHHWSGANGRFNGHCCAAVCLHLQPRCYRTGYHFPPLLRALRRSAVVNARLFRLRTPVTASAP